MEITKANHRTNGLIGGGFKYCVFKVVAQMPFQLGNLALANNLSDSVFRFWGHGTMG